MLSFLPITKDSFCKRNNLLVLLIGILRLEKKFSFDGETVEQMQTNTITNQSTTPHDNVCTTSNLPTMRYLPQSRGRLVRDSCHQPSYQMKRKNNYYNYFSTIEIHGSFLRSTHQYSLLS